MTAMEADRVSPPKRGAWLVRTWAVAAILPLVAYADQTSAPAAGPSLPGDCAQLLKRAEKSFAAMPSGVEKSAAKEQLSAARAALSEGQTTDCKTHVKNAVTAMKSK